MIAYFKTIRLLSFSRDFEVKLSSIVDQRITRQKVFNANFQKSSSNLVQSFLSSPVHTHISRDLSNDLLYVYPARCNHLTSQRNRSNVGIISEVPAGAKRSSFAPLLRARNFSTGIIDGRAAGEPRPFVMFTAQYSRGRNTCRGPEPLRSLTPGALSLSRPQDAAVAHHPTAVHDRRYPSSLNWASSRSG